MKVSFNKFYIKKWFKMLTGNSILHVNQEQGKFYKKEEVCGYYNDLRNKVLKSGLGENELPKTELPNGKKIDFSIAIFQYGLGSYDLYLETKNKKYYDRFMKTVQWAEVNQEDNGGWITFNNECKNNPYSSMAQGEGISLLLRAYKETNEKKYFFEAKNAIDFMLKKIDDNGCTMYEGDDVFFKEFPEKSVVLNGWIFSIFGLYDYCIIENNKNNKNILNKTIITLKKNISKFDNGYWSMYDANKKIASPFYHKLHIELLKVLGEITGEEIFITYALKFEKYKNKRINRFRAFIKKAFQKLLER